MNIGLGVPVGREGPIAKLGGVVSEIFVDFLKIDKIHSQIYITCGISSAISATFNAPAAGVLFGLEIILGRINNYILIPLLISCTVASVISEWIFGDFAAFKTPTLKFTKEEFLLIPVAVVFFFNNYLYLFQLLPKNFSCFFS